MKVVIQCAAGKRAEAGSLQAADGRPVRFVAHPELVPCQSDCLYAHPDDVDATGVSWRSKLLQYNAHRRSGNELGLLPAYLLYRNPIYQSLARKFGTASLYILSAGWGLVEADFLVPSYDITFSMQAASDKRRRRRDRFEDFCRLPQAGGDDVLFLGAKAYLDFFCQLTKSYTGRRIAWAVSSMGIAAPGCELIHFPTRRRTNWHYECAQRLIDGTLSGVLNSVIRGGVRSLTARCGHSLPLQLPAVFEL